MTTRTRLPGSARRRAKAIARRRWVIELDGTQALVQDRLPQYWTALDMCPCGRTAWLLQGASDEEREEFDRDSADHMAYCEAGAA